MTRPTRTRATRTERLTVYRRQLAHFHALVDYQNDMQYMKCVDVKGKK